MEILEKADLELLEAEKFSSNHRSVLSVKKG